MSLNEPERAQTGVVKVQEYLDTRERALMAQIKDLKLSHEDTQGIRYTLKEIGKIKAFINPPEPPKMPQTDPYFRDDK